MRKLIYILFFIFSTFALASTEQPGESAVVTGVSGFINVYVIEEEGKLPNSWDDVFRHDGFFDRTNAAYRNQPKGFTELYSFIAEEDRSKFPNGELLLIRYEPRAWPEVWKHTSPDVAPAELTDEQRAEFKRLADREQPIRYLIYRNKSGELDSVWWFEGDVQKMLAETGIRVPKPEPYQAPSVEVIQSPSVVVENSFEPLAVKSEVKEPSEVVSVEITKEAPKKSSQWLLWLIGALVVLGGLALVVRRKS